MVNAMEPLLDSIPVDLKKWTVKGSIADKWKNRKPIGALLRSGIIRSVRSVRTDLNFKV